MPLTAGHAAYGALHQSGINTFIHHVFVARPHYFHYATPILRGGNINIGPLPPLPVPGMSGGMEFSVDIAQPVIDFAPQDATSTLPPPLVIGADQFSIATAVRVCIACGLIGKRDQGEREQEARRPELVCTRLRLWAVGHPTVGFVGGDKAVGLQIDDIIVKEICDLEKIVECVAKEMVNVLLDNLKYTVKTMMLQGFGVLLAAGPQIADDQIKIWADIV